MLGFDLHFSKPFKLVVPLCFLKNRSCRFRFQSFDLKVFHARPHKNIKPKHQDLQAWAEELEAVDCLFPLNRAIRLCWLRGWSNPTTWTLYLCWDYTAVAPRTTRPTSCFCHPSRRRGRRSKQSAGRCRRASTGCSGLRSAAGTTSPLRTLPGARTD